MAVTITAQVTWAVAASEMARREATKSYLLLEKAKKTQRLHDLKNEVETDTSSNVNEKKQMLSSIGKKDQPE